MAIWSGLGLGSTGATVTAAAAALAIAIGGTVLIQQSRSTEPATGATDVPAQPVVQTVPAAGGSGNGSSIAAGTETASLTAPSQGQAGAVDGSDANVSATVIGGNGVTPEGGGQAPSVAPSSNRADATDTVDQPAYPAPRFDLVRIEGDGSTVIAGKSVAGKPVRIMDGDTVLAELVADRTGSFVAFLNLDRPGQARVLTLVMDAGDDGLVQSDESVLVTPPAGSDAVVAEATPRTDDAATADSGGQVSETQAATDETVTQAPTIIIASNDGTRVVQPAIDNTAPDVMSNVTIDAISYDNRGEVVLAGRGSVAGHVRVYVDNRPVKTLKIASDGSWSTDLPEVDAGVYTLRVDELDQDGSVTSRVETPFQKEFPEDAKRALGLEQDDAEGATVQADGPSGDGEVVASAPAVSTDAGSQSGAGTPQPATTQAVTATPSSGADQTVVDSTQGGQPSANLASMPETSVAGASNAPKSQASPQTPSAMDDAPTAPAIEAVTVQPGSTLWELAERNYGEGNQYVRIYTANKDQIRNPDLIYPGQIFEIPE